MTEDIRFAPSEESEAQPPERRRTVLIWVIFAWICFGLLSALVVLGLSVLGIRLAGSPQLGLLQYVLSLISMSVYFAGGLALFNLRAKAVKFLALGLAFTLVAQVYGLITLRTADLTPPNGIDIDTWRGTLRAGVLWGLV